MSEPVDLLSAQSLGLPSIVKAGDTVDLFDRLAGAAHVLGPISSLETIPPGYQVVIRVVRLSLRRGIHTYSQSGGLAPNKPALRALAGVSALSFLSELSGRTDDRSDPDLASYMAVAELTLIDGRKVQRFAEKTVDLRKGSELRQKCKPGDLATKRKFIDRLAQEKATNAVIRDALCLRQVYSADDLALPFVAFGLQYVGFGTAEERRIAALVACGASAAVYGAVLGAPNPVDDVAPILGSPAQAQAQIPETYRDTLDGDAFSPSETEELAEAVRQVNEQHAEQVATQTPATFQATPAMVKAYAVIGVNADQVDEILAGCATKADVVAAYRKAVAEHADRADHEDHPSSDGGAL